MAKITDKELQNVFDDANKTDGSISTPEPAFQRYQRNWLRQTSHAHLNRFRPEELISSARTHEEILLIGQFLKKKYGNNHPWWTYYHKKRVDLAHLPSLYGVVDTADGKQRGLWGAPINAQEYLRQSTGSKAQRIAVDRHLYPELVSFEQATGRKPIFKVVEGGDGARLRKWNPIKGATLKSNTLSNAIIFDLETTGLLKKGNVPEILSLGYQQTKAGKTIDQGGMYANFIKTKTYDPAIENKILPQYYKAVKRAGKTIPEKDIIKNFISMVENAPKGVAIAGYNIKEFDIPVLRASAAKYGLSESLEKAINSANIIDIAESAKSFLSKTIGGKVIGWQSGGVGIKPSGWQLETVAKSLGYKGGAAAHEAQADVAMTKFVAQMLQNEDKAQKAFNFDIFKKSVKQSTGKEILEVVKGMGSVNHGFNMMDDESKYIRSFSAHLDELFPDRAIAKKIPVGRAASLIGKINKKKVFKSALGYSASMVGSSLVFPGNFWHNMVSSAGFEATRLGAKGLGAGNIKSIALGMAVSTSIGIFLRSRQEDRDFLVEQAIKDKGFSFSGKDDYYNTIEGLRHGGAAEFIRKDLTQFGSGWTREKLIDKAYILEGNDENETLKHTKAQFNWFKGALDEYGEKVSTGHKRIVIPKEIITQKELIDLGFIGVKIAIPEAGQATSTSFRHPDVRYHLHDFDDSWTMHRDEHVSSTMMVHKSEQAGDDSFFTAAKHLIAGLPHLITEGLPGAAYYIRGKITGTDSMKDRLLQDLSQEYLDTVGLNRPVNPISGKDDDYNTIEGLRHGGMAEQTRKKLTDFGSGYQNNNNTENTNTNTFIKATGAIAAGAASYRWMDRLIYPFADKDISKHSQLLKMREIGVKEGFKTYDPQAFVNFHEGKYLSNKLKKKTVMDFLFGSLNPTSSLRELKNFEGLTYVHTGIEGIEEATKNPLNVGNWDIGNNKLTTYDFLKNKGIGDLHVETMPAGEFFMEGEGAEEFLEKAGGSFDNIVLKRNEDALGRGVWLNLNEVPEDIQEMVAWNPKEFLVQRKLDIAEEFRVVTVGGLPIHTTYRFGSPTTRKMMKKQGFTAMKDLANKDDFKGNPFEIIQPVFHKETKKKLEDFATKASKHLPYEISALDIAMTKDGELKIIEAQRAFGNISNPIVGNRMRYAITGKKTKTAIALAGAAALTAGIVTYSSLPDSNKPLEQISGKDDDYNTIEGLRHGGMAQDIRKKLTDFGSGWDSLRAMSKTLFKSADDSFGEMIASKEFKEALSSAKSIKELGIGAAGVTHLMEGSIRGQKFRFARKTGGIFENEIAAMKTIEESVGPSVYGHGEGYIDMEFFAGNLIGDVDKGLLKSMPNLEGEVASAFGKLHEKGYRHGDTLGNVMLVDTAEGKKRIGLIDLGAAKPLSDFDPAEAYLQTRNDIETAQETLNAAMGESTFASSFKPAFMTSEAPKAKGAADDSMEGFFDMFDQPSTPSKTPSSSSSTIDFDLFGMSEQKERVRRVKRVKRFNKISTSAVGIGHRAAYRAGRKHSRFRSRISV